MRELYSKNKTIIKVYVICALIISILAGVSFAGRSAAAAGAASVGAVRLTAFSIFATVVLHFIKMIILLPLWFFIRFFCFALNSLGSLLFPGAGAAGKILRGGFIVSQLFLREKFPVVFYIQYALLFIVSLIFFEWALRTIRYLDSIYLKPVTDKIFRRKVRIKRPKGFETEDLVIPVFALINRGGVKIRKRENWWLIADEGKVSFLRRRFGFRKEKRIDPSDLYIYRTGFKGFDCYEIFKLEDPDKKAVGRNKILSFVYSRRYKDPAVKLIEEYGFKDYGEVKKAKKLQKEMERELKRAQLESLSEDALFDVD